MKKNKVLYFLNYAPNYRDKFLRELGKFVDLTVVSYDGKEANLRDPEQRIGYKYISLKRIRVLGVNFNLKEFTLANGHYDIIIVGYSLWFPFRMINLFRRKKRIIGTGIIYGRNKDFLTKFFRKIFVNSGEGYLVYSEIVKNRLMQETKKPIIVFNNTSYSKSEINPIPLPPIKGRLNIIWVGRYQERKKVKRFYDIAKEDNRVNIRLIGPGIKEAFRNFEKLDNLVIYEGAYGQELYSHFKWSHITFNPGGAGLLVMNSARLQRSIVIDINGYHGPEVQLAIDANQDFIDFSNMNIIDSYIDKIFHDPKYLEMKAKELCLKMHNYTIEYMTERYMDAIEGRWV